MKLIVSLILITLLLLVFALPVYAMDEPDSVDLIEEDIELFGDLNATGDILAIVPYYIPFTTQPDDSIDKTFMFQILSPDGSTINGTSLAYPKYTGGYGYGVVSFYFSSGMTWESAFIFRIQQNPVFYPTPQHWDFSITSSHFSDAADQESALRDKIIEMARWLEEKWTADLLASSETGETVLSTDGEIYFTQAIPGLLVLCPSLFSVQVRNPDYSKRSWTNTLADSLQTKYAGTWVENFMTGYAGLFSMQTSSAMTFLSVVVFVLLMLLAVWKFKADMYSCFVDGYAILLLMMLFGFFNMVYAGLLAFVSVMAGGIILFLNRS